MQIAIADGDFPRYPQICIDADQIPPNAKSCIDTPSPQPSPAEGERERLAELWMELRSH
jgi:hypothetical protein